MLKEIPQEVTDFGNDQLNIKFIHFFISSDPIDNNRFCIYENGKLNIESTVACKGYKTIFSFCDTNKDLYVKNYERFIYTFKNIRCTSFQLSFWCKLINDEIVDIMEESIECTCEYIKNDKDDMEKQVMGGQFFK